MNTQNNGCPNPDGSCKYWDGPCSQCYPAWAKKKRLAELFEDMQDPDFMEAFTEAALRSVMFRRMVVDFMEQEFLSE